jgi:PAS domain-containing protein
MNDFFGTQYSQEDLQQRVAQRRRGNGSARAMTMSMVQPAPSPPQGNESAMDMTGMVGGDSLDDIIMQNSKEIQRRQSLPTAYPGQEVDRRSSMMEFGSSNANINGFQFGAPPTGPGDPNLRRQSTGELEMAGGYGDLSLGMSMTGHQIGFSTMPGSEPLTIDTNVPFPRVSADLVHDMMGYGSIGIEDISEEDTGLNMYSPNDFSQQFGSGNIQPMANDFIMPGPVHDALPSHRDSMHAGDDNDNDMMPGMPGLSVSDSNMVNSPTSISINQNLAPYGSPVTANVPPNVLNQDSVYSNLATTVRPASTPQVKVIEEEPKPNYKHIYSASGFDMLGALTKVATRKNPEIDIGKVDMSCAFVVCDITQPDCPIVYVSEIFERLTGYTKYEILGRNCRFLQSPEGKVQAGAQRDFCDNESVYYLKKRISANQEAQRSLINYRKGGQPFMNLLTMIPISGEDNDKIKYFVGFQVDLVEKPTSIENKNANGMYSVDYSQGTLPRYVWQPPGDHQPYADEGQTISRDDVSTVLSSINSNTESELTKRMWDKVLLENTDDVVHVLSLKGLFLYLSPSCRHVLEYDTSELLGTALSSVCHPSDIVPVTRELKDTSTGAAINVVFRIRRKKSGYTWFESHGSLCVEQGKGRKCIILVGRERPVYALARHDIEAAGGIGENEMWTKLSTSGMFLFVSANVQILLDRSPDDLVGTSIQALMRSESRVEFGRSLEKARTGKRLTHKHEVLNKRGLVLQAQTTLYPGDASEGQKPTFLVAQTRLLKTSSRAVAPALGSQGSSKSMGPMGKVDASPDSSPISSGIPSQLSQEPSPSKSNVSLVGPITHAGGAGLAIGTQDVALASEDNIFDELKTTRCTSWQYELRQMEKSNRQLSEELACLLSNKKKRKRRKGAGHLQRDCANCHTRVTPEWRRGPSGQRDLCNSCGLRWAKQVSRTSDHSDTIRQATKSLSKSDSSTSRS